MRSGLGPTGSDRNPLGRVIACLQTDKKPPSECAFHCVQIVRTKQQPDENMVRCDVIIPVSAILPVDRLGASVFPLCVVYFNAMQYTS